MNAPIPHAVRNLRLVCGVPESAVRRADLGRAGEVWLEIETRGVRRWFRQGSELAQVHPREDERLPLVHRVDWERGDVELLGWRPGKRVVLATHEGGRRVVLKGLRPRRLEATSDRFARGHTALGDSDDFLVPAATLDAARAALRFEWIDFEPLGLGQRCETAFHQVGGALRAFQAKVPTEGLAVHDFEAELRVLEELAARHQRAMGELPARWCAAWEDLRSTTPPGRTELVAVHRDLHDGQLLGDGERLALLDLDLLAVGSPLLDVANLSAHLVLRALQGEGQASPESAEGCGRALLLGFGIGDAAEDYLELRAYQAATFLRLALVYSMRPAWQAVVPDLVRYAERCLDEPHLV